LGFAISIAVFAMGAAMRAGADPPTAGPSAPSSPLQPGTVLPPEPRLAPLSMPAPPTTFCSEAARGRYLVGVLNPTFEAASANMEKAQWHLQQISVALADAISPDDLAAGRRAYAAYKPTEVVRRNS